MKLKSIKRFKSGPYKRLKDEIGALDKSIKLKRIEPYVDIIEEVLKEHNKDNDKRTMMFKLIRRPTDGTTTRESHSKNVSEIAKKISKPFKWLNSGITSVIADNHDTGHTPFGHSGEWWISSISEEYGMPYYVHNSAGTRKLVYRENVCDKIADRIKEKHPNISSRKLYKIKRDLWLVFDGINCHNGEKSDYSYSPDFSKEESDFCYEIMGCYVKKGFDKTLIPATAEGSLMRLCDKISYIPFDMVDIFRNECNKKELIINGEEHDLYKEYKKQLGAIGMPEDSFERLLECKTNEDYDNFAKEIQGKLIEDVIKNSKRNNIRMSKKMSEAMHGIRNINNQMMVNYVVLKEDHEVYPVAIEQLMLKYGTEAVKTGAIKLDSEGKISINQEIAKEYANNLKAASEKVMSGFFEFLYNTNPEDFEFTVESCKKSLEETVDSELDIARSLVTAGKDVTDVKAIGAGAKKERIDTYINDFKNSLQMAYSKEVFQENSRNPLNDFKKRIWLKKTKAKIKEEALSGNMSLENAKGIKPLCERVAMNIGAQYIGSLYDEQFFDLIKKAGLIEEQEESLRRQYNKIDFRSEGKPHEAWVQIVESQKSQKIPPKNNRGILNRLRNCFGREH